MSRLNKSPVGLFVVNAAIAVLFVVIALVLAKAGLSFGQQLLTAALIIAAGSQLSKLTRKTLPDFHWPIFAKGAGWVFLIAVIVNSSFVQRILQEVSEVENAVSNSGFDAIACPESQSVSRIGDVIVIRKRCGTHNIRIPRYNDALWSSPTGWQFLDNRFRNDVDYVTIRWDDNNPRVYNIEPKNNWPEGVEMVEMKLERR